MHIFFVFGDTHFKMSHQIVYGQNKNVRASNTEGVKQNPILLYLLFIFRDHFYAKFIHDIS